MGASTILDECSHSYQGCGAHAQIPGSGVKNRQIPGPFQTFSLRVLNKAGRRLVTNLELMMKATCLTKAIFRSMESGLSHIFKVN